MPRRLPLDADRAQEADDEFSHHLRLLVEELVQAGLSPEEARREAIRRFGSVSRLRAEVTEIDRDHDRDRRRAGWWDAIVQDLRFAWRTLRGDPGYSVVAILSLALGVGATTTMISAVDAVDRRALRFPDGDRLVRIEPLNSADDPGCPRCDRGVALVEIERWRREIKTADRIEAWDNAERLWHHEGEVETVNFAAVTEGVLDLFGRRPVLGRGFQPADAVPGAPLVVVLDEGFWRRRFGADSGVIGSTVWLAPRDVERARAPVAYTVVGVVPMVPGLESERDNLVQVWAMAAALPDVRPDRRRMLAMARVKPGVLVATLAAEFDRAIRLDSTGSSPSSGARVMPVRLAMLREFGPVRSRFILLGVVGLVLVLVAVNVANLALARADRRRAELAIRASIGAGRGRIVRQLLTESVAVALAGGLLGTILAIAGTGLASSRLRLPLLGVTATVDVPTLTVAVIISIATGILFGLAPALGLSRVDPGESFRAATTRGVARSLDRRVEAGLVVAQIAMASMLVAGAGLLARELIRLERSRIGFDPRGLHQVVVPSPESAARDPIATRVLADRVSEHLKVLPGFSAATVFTGTLESEVRAVGGGPSAPEPIVVDVEPSFISVLGAAMVRGRDFGPTDAGTPVAIVSAHTARLLWPDQDPIGRQLRISNSAETATSTVIGVVADARWNSMLRADQVMVYRPPAARPGRGVVVLARAEPGTVDPISRLTKAIAEVSGARPAANEVRSMDQFIGDQFEGPGLNALVVAAFAGVAVLLAAMGIAGVVAVAVGRRTREIGIRMALGARPVAIVGLVTRRGLWLAVGGIGAGLAGSLLASRALRSLLYLTSPSDPLILLGTAVGLGAVAVVAAWAPARRAVKLDPTSALQSD